MSCSAAAAAASSHLLQHCGLQGGSAAQLQIAALRRRRDDGRPGLLESGGYRGERGGAPQVRQLPHQMTSRRQPAEDVAVTHSGKPDALGAEKVQQPRNAHR
eukprot:scaffold140296_cov115-Phaeocystis_antarctica.AAC.1